LLDIINTDLWLRFRLAELLRGRCSVVILGAAERAARAASGYLALGRVQRIFRVQHADDTPRGAPSARRAAIGRRVVEPAIGGRPVLELAEVVKREHGRKGHRVLGVVADHYGRGPKLPATSAVDRGFAVRRTAAVVHHHAAHVAARVAAERPVQRRVVVQPATELPVLVMVVSRLVALVQAVTLAAQASRPVALALPTHRPRPRLATLSLHLGFAHLQPADHHLLYLRLPAVTRPHVFCTAVRDCRQLIVFIATCEQTNKRYIKIYSNT